MKKPWLLLGMALVLAGLVSLLYFAAAVLDLLPEAASGWPIPDRLHVGLGFALFGIAAMGLGAFLSLRRSVPPTTRAEGAHVRVEPFIGGATEARGDAAVPGFRRMRRSLVR